MQNVKANFKKSSFSEGQYRCVEVAIANDKILVRHSKEQKETLSFTFDEWNAFLQGVKNKEFDLC